MFARIVFAFICSVLLVSVIGCHSETSRTSGGLQNSPPSAVSPDEISRVAAIGDPAEFQKALDAEPWLVYAKEVPLGRTLLHWCALEGKDDNVKLLLDRGADANARDGLGRTPLFNAVTLHRKSTLELLLSRGAQVGARDKHGITPLFAACAAAAVRRDRFRDPNDMVKLLLGRGADVNVRDPQGTTPLLGVVMLGHPDTAAILIAHGADIRARSKHGWTALELAERMKNKEMLRILRGDVGSR